MRNPPDDGRFVVGDVRLTLAECEALYAVAIAAVLREMRGDKDHPRARLSIRTEYKHAHAISVRSQTADRLLSMGLIAMPYRRVYGEAHDYGPVPVLTPEGSRALASRWEIAIVARAKALHEGTDG